MDIEFTPEMTAISTGTSAGTHELIKELNSDSLILDYGFGKGRNTIALSQHFKNIHVADTAKQIENNKDKVKSYIDKIFDVDEEIKHKYDGILCTFVLNVLDDDKLRRDILRKVYDLLKTNGTLIIQVRTEKDLKNTKSKSPYKDGYVVKKGKGYTFQKGYTEEDVINLFSSLSIPIDSIKNNGNNIMVISKKRSTQEYGQMSYKSLSPRADYLQLDVCGKSPEEAIKRFLDYKISMPVIIHGDWTKKGANENNLRDRINDYVSIIDGLKEYTTVLGITIHPPSKSKYNINEVLHLAKVIYLLTGVTAFIENRSNNMYIVSNPEDVIKCSGVQEMTIDLPQLYIACNFDEDLFYKVLNKINWENVHEIHLGNIKRKTKELDGKNITSVAQKINSGIMNYKKIKPYIVDVPYITFEILGSGTTFEEQLNTYLNL